MKPTPPSYPPLEWLKKPFPERARMVCEAWALQGYGIPPAIYLVLGWSFGDGQLHREPLLAAVQEQCGFTPGELRCIFVEGQPFGRATMDYRIHDAATGLLDRGTLDVTAMRKRQPWSAS